MPATEDRERKAGGASPWSSAEHHRRRGPAPPAKAPPTASPAPRRRRLKPTQLLHYIHPRLEAPPSSRRRSGRRRKGDPAIRRRRGGSDGEVTNFALDCSAENGGIQEDNSPLQSLKTYSCGELFSRWPMGEAGGGAQTIYPFPASLRKLDVWDEPSMKSMALLSNLTSLTGLILTDCSNLTVDGFNPLTAVNLKKLEVHNSNTVAADLLSEVVRTKLLPAGYISRLEELVVDALLQNRASVAHLNGPSVAHGPCATEDEPQNSLFCGARPMRHRISYSVAHLPACATE